MATCQQPPCNPQCQTLQVIEPDNTLIVGTIGAGVDMSLDEHGDYLLAGNQDQVSITFQMPKAGDYRFEYLYVDCLNGTLPGIVECSVTYQNAYYFTVKFAGVPLNDGQGYILRWRAKVISIVPPGTTPQPDAPENIYVQLPMANSISVFFHALRSTQTYGFTELRVENLIDLPGSQVAIQPQIVAKMTDHCIVALSPTPPNNNYYLALRTP